MSKLKIYLLLSAIVAFCSSCSTLGPQINLYGPAMYQNDVSYQPKPMSSDSGKQAVYVSASYYDGNAPNSNNNIDEIKNWQLNVGQGYTFKNCNLAYGAFGGIGSYNNNVSLNPTQTTYFESKSFGNVGGRFSVNGFFTTGNVDIRIIGLEMAYSHEFGDYANFRKNINGKTNYFVDTQTDLVTIGGSSEVIWHTNQNPVQFGFRIFIGQTLGDHSYKNATAYSQQYYPRFTPSSFSYFMQIYRYFFIGELNPNGGGQLRLGMRF